MPRWARTASPSRTNIARIAREGGLRLLGPNCLGVFNPQIGFFGTFTQSLDKEMPGPGPLAIVSQSGAYGSHIAYLARQRGIGINYWITTGNEADVDVAQCLEWMAVQPDIKVIMAYVEGVRDGERFRRALALARENRKPVIMMKVGRSEIGAKAASSHTASLAGSDAIYDALFRQYGVHRSTTTEEQIDIAYACARGIYPRSNKLGVVTLSGGAGVLISDSAERNGLDVSAHARFRPGQAQGTAAVCDRGEPGRHHRTGAERHEPARPQSRGDA